MSGNQGDWPHPQEAMLNGYVTYVCKYEGIYDVSEPKGMLIVQEAFKQMREKKKNRKYEGVKRAPLVDFRIGVEGVKVIYQDTQAVQMQTDLQSISYIASDGANQRYLAFVSNKKETNGFECTILKNEGGKTKEIVKSLGQAFDLAFRKNVDNVDKPSQESGSSKLGFEAQASILRNRLLDLSKWIPQVELRQYMEDHCIKNITEVISDQEINLRKQQKQGTAHDPTYATVDKPAQVQPIVGTKLLELDLNAELQPSDIVPAPPARLDPSSNPAPAPVPRANETPQQSSSDPFGMGLFSEQPQQQQLAQPQQQQIVAQPQQQQQVAQPQQQPMVAQPQQHMIFQPQQQQMAQPQQQQMIFQQPQQQQMLFQPQQQQVMAQPQQQMMTQPQQQMAQPQQQSMSFMMQQPQQQMMGLVQNPGNPAAENPMKSRSASNPFGENLMEIPQVFETIEFDPLK